MPEEKEDDEKLVVLEFPDNSPLKNIGKLLAGFCDPRGGAGVEDDDDTVSSSTHSVNPAPRSIHFGERSMPVPADETTATPDEADVVSKEEPEDMSEAKMVPTKRRKHGIEVFLASAATVLGTFIALNYFGYGFDVMIVQNPLRSSSGSKFFFGGSYKKNSSDTESSTKKKWIEFAQRMKEETEKESNEEDQPVSSDTSETEDHVDEKEEVPPLKPEPIESYSDDEIEQEILREILGEDLLLKL